MVEKNREIGKRIKSELKHVYGDRIAVCNGTSHNYAFSCEEDYLKTVDIVIYLNYQKQVAIIWNNWYRRKMEASAHCFEWSYEIDRGKIKSGQIDDKNKSFKTSNGLVQENVFIMSFDTLCKNINDLHDMVCWEEAGINQSDRDSERSGNYPGRGRRLVSQWNRDVKFRSAVLEDFDKQCAVCRCKEEKLLEAAHITAVCDGGPDTVENGICLCANHHIMLDTGLITIDYKNMKLEYISDSVKEMPWYKEYVENGYQLVERKKH